MRNPRTTPDEKVALLQSVLREVLSFLEKKEWGTYTYMEGSDVYSDKDDAIVTIRDALMRTE